MSQEKFEKSIISSELLEKINSGALSFGDFEPKDYQVRRKISPRYTDYDYSIPKEAPFFERRDFFPFSEESQQCLIAAKQNALKNNRVMVHAGDILVGLLSLERRFDSKLSRIFQQYFLVPGYENTFDQPNQQEQKKIINAKIFLNSIVYGFQEHTVSRIDIFGGIQFSEQAYLVLKQAKQITMDNELLLHSTDTAQSERKISPVDIFVGMINHGDNLGYRALTNILPQRTSPERDFRFELRRATTPVDRKHVAFRMLQSVR